MLLEHIIKDKLKYCKKMSQVTPSICRSGIILVEVNIEEDVSYIGGKTGDAKRVAKNYRRQIFVLLHWH